MVKRKNTITPDLDKNNETCATPLPSQSNSQSLDFDEALNNISSDESIKKKVKNDITCYILKTDVPENIKEAEHKKLEKFSLVPSRIPFKLGVSVADVALIQCIPSVNLKTLQFENISETIYSQEITLFKNKFVEEGWLFKIKLTNVNIVKDIEQEVVNYTLDWSKKNNLQGGFFESSINTDFQANYYLNLKSKFENTLFFLKHGNNKRAVDLKEFCNMLNVVSKKDYLIKITPTKTCHYEKKENLLCFKFLWQVDSVTCQLY